MSSGNVGGTGSTPPVTTSTTVDQKEVDQKGKVPGGPEVTKGGGSTPIKDGSNSVETTVSEKKIDTRKTELKHDFEVTVSHDDDGDEDVFMNPVQGEHELTLFSEEDIKQLETAALREEGLLFEDALDNAVDTMKKESKAMKSFKKVGAKIADAFRAFANVFRPEPKVAEALAKGTAQLVDVAVAGMDEKEAEAVASEIATGLKDDPNAVLKDMEARGLSEVVADIKDTMRVATKKNLTRMKSKLMDSAANFPALQDMSTEARELIINATLCAAKLGNPGDKKTDVTQLISRGYVVGKIPVAKLRLVETVLNQAPESAVSTLKGWLTDTNFGSQIDDALNEKELDGVSDLFKGNELEVDNNPAGVQRSAVETAMPRARAQATGLNVFMDDVLSDINPDTIKKFKQAAEEAKDDPIGDIRNLFKDEKNRSEKLEVDENPRAPQIDKEATKVNQAKRQTAKEAEAFERKRDDIRRQTEERRQELMSDSNLAAAKAHGQQMHNALQDNTRFNSIHRDKEALKELLPKYESAKAKVVNEGGLTPASSDQLAKLQSSMEEALISQGAGDADALVRGILVATKLAAWTDPKSSDDITMLGSAMIPKFYDDAMGTAAMMAEQDPEVLRGSLLQNLVVKNSDFESKLLQTRFVPPGQESEE